MDWVAFCVDCGRDVYDKIPNGAFVHAGASLHVKKHPGHRVIVGYEVEEAEQVSYRMVCSNAAFDKRR